MWGEFSRCIHILSLVSSFDLVHLLLFTALVRVRVVNPIIATICWRLFVNYWSVDNQTRRNLFFKETFWIAYDSAKCSHWQEVHLHTRYLNCLLISSCACIMNLCRQCTLQVKLLISSPESVVFPLCSREDERQHRRKNPSENCGFCL